MTTFLSFAAVIGTLPSDNYEASPLSHATIDETVLELHESYCRRNLQRCEVCREMIAKAEMEAHNLQFHKEVQCQYCSLACEIGKLDVHLEVCQQRPKTCSFCSGRFDPKDYGEHSYHCGSRTVPCDFCEDYIILRGKKSSQVIY